MDGIAKTSLLTAAMRAAETMRGEGEARMFSDPFAKLLAGDEGLALMRKAVEETGDQPAIAIRTAYMDHKINEAVKEGVRQFVILAAGMDSRAYRLSFPEGTRLFELDRAEVLRYKEEKLASAKPRCIRHALPVDLRDEWQGSLREAGFSVGEKTLWLVEGLLMYLHESQVSTLIERVNSLASPGDIMLFDILTRTMLDAPHMKKQLEFLESMGAPWRFGVNEPEEFMTKFGWKAVATQAGEFAPHRWPFPTAPRSVPNVPRGFYMEARYLAD